MSTILLFEDDDGNREFVKGQIEGLNVADLAVDVFTSDTVPERGLTYEQFIERQLVERTLEIGLIACDQELGLYNNLPGLSANAVSVVARNLGIPFCQYSQHPKANAREITRFKALQRWDSEEITLTECRDNWAKEIVDLWSGFERFREGYKTDGVAQLKPSEALAMLMGRSAVSSRVALYGSGDQTVMTEIFGFTGDDDPKLLQQRMPRVIGTWLRLSLLRFPGLLVNAVAAASYLNISVADFDRPEVRTHFKSALYGGPFSGLSESWWRDDLDSRVLEADKKDGKELLADAGIEVAECLDDETQERAGYYCMITESPVSRSNSKGNINWFPSGADLARIRSSKYDQITSLVRM